MKIIDILNAKANGTLEDGFKFCYKDRVYTYSKEMDNIDQGSTENTLGRRYVLENCLNDEVLLFQEASKTQQEDKEIEELNDTCSDVENMLNTDIDYYNNLTRKKINELVRAVNKLTKEREVK